MSSHDDMGKIPAGECPEHGLVFGNSVQFNFPNPATCDRDGCGKELEVAALATGEEIEKVGAQRAAENGGIDE